MGSHLPKGFTANATDFGVQLDNGVIVRINAGSAGAKLLTPLAASIAAGDNIAFVAGDAKSDPTFEKTNATIAKDKSDAGELPYSYHGTYGMPGSSPALHAARAAACGKLGVDAALAQSKGYLFHEESLRVGDVVTIYGSRSNNKQSPGETGGAIDALDRDLSSGWSCSMLWVMPPVTVSGLVVLRATRPAAAAVSAAAGDDAEVGAPAAGPGGGAAAAAGDSGGGTAPVDTVTEFTCDGRGGDGCGTAEWVNVLIPLVVAGIIVGIMFGTMDQEEAVKFLFILLVLPVLYVSPLCCVRKGMLNAKKLQLLRGTSDVASVTGRVVQLAPGPDGAGGVPVLRSPMCLAPCVAWFNYINEEDVGGD